MSQYIQTLIKRGGVVSLYSYLLPLSSDQSVCLYRCVRIRSCYLVYLFFRCSQIGDREVDTTIWLLIKLGVGGGLYLFVHLKRAGRFCIPLFISVFLLLSLSGLSPLPNRRYRVGIIMYLLIKPVGGRFVSLCTALTVSASACCVFSFFRRSQIGEV